VSAAILLFAATAIVGPSSEPAAPLDTPQPDPPPGTRRPPAAAPFAVSRPRQVGEPEPPVATPFGKGGARGAALPLDPKATRLVRVDLLFGPLWRIRRADTALVTGVEVGRMHGLSGAFNTGMIIVTDREVVLAFDFPINGGVVVRGRARTRPLYASIGLCAGILVHRAKTEQGLVHRVDPDFRVPIRFAWTIATVGISVALEQGYSVRHRSYERRGVEVWERHAYRIGFVLGLHSDFMAGRPNVRRSGLRRRVRR
jgi:hypothetical protein